MNFGDLVLFQTEWLYGSNGEGTSDCDMNADGALNYGDLNLFIKHFGQAADGQAPSSL